jgi:hypothetical protein
LINVAELSAGRQQLSPSPAWHRLVSQQQRLMFCANRPDIDVGLHLQRDEKANGHVSGGKTAALTLLLFICAPPRTSFSGKSRIAVRNF